MLMTIETTRLDELLGRFPRGRIMVVGDLMLDEYVRGVVDRVSPEAPIPVVNIINSALRDVRLGGAESVEQIMWLAMRGAMPEKIRKIHQNYSLATTTAMTVVVYEGEEETTSSAVASNQSVAV